MEDNTQSALPGIRPVPGVEALFAIAAVAGMLSIGMAIGRGMETEFELSEEFRASSEAGSVTEEVYEQEVSRFAQRLNEYIQETSERGTAPEFIIEMNVLSPTS